MNVDTTKSMPRGLSRYLPSLFCLFALAPFCLNADQAHPIGPTGYTITIPTRFNVFNPPNAPKIHLQASNPEDTASIQVVQEAPAPLSTLISNYEGTMRTSLGDLRQTAEVPVVVAGLQSKARQYSCFANGMNLDIVTVFYSGSTKAFVIHSISTGVNVEQLFPYLTSLQAPKNSTNPTGSISSTGSIGGLDSGSSSPPSYTPPPQTVNNPRGSQNAGSLGAPVSLFQSGFTFNPPAGWSQQTNTETSTLSFAAPDQSAKLEIAWAINEEPDQDLSVSAADALKLIVSQTGAPGLRLTLENEDGNNFFYRKLAVYKTDANGGMGLGFIVALNASDIAIAYGYAGSSDKAQQRNLLKSLRSLKGPAKAAVIKPKLPTTPPPPVSNNTAPSTEYQALVVDDAGLEFSIPPRFKRIEHSEGKSEWADPNAPDPKIVMVIQSIMRSAGQTVDSVRDDLVGQVNGSSAAQMVENSSTTINGLKAHKLHFTLDSGGELQHFRFIVLDLPGPCVATVSFTAPASQNVVAERHYQEVLRTAQSTTVVARPGVSHPAGNAQPGNTPAEPGSAKAAYFALADAVAKGQWDWVIKHMTQKAHLDFCKRFRDAIPNADMTEADAQKNPTGTLREYLNYRMPKETLAGYFETDRTITGVREENPDWHLVMSKKSSGGEHYLWFKRINGVWRFDF